MDLKKYVVHYCKNGKCNNAWLDYDLTNAKTNPPRWKYCSECVEKYGYINPEIPPKKKLSKKQKDNIENFVLSILNKHKEREVDNHE